MFFKNNILDCFCFCVVFVFDIRHNFSLLHIIFILYNILLHLFEMRILSIDVGIKNLALCCFEKKEGDTFFQITHWDILNIGEKETLVCLEKEKEKEKEKPLKKSKSKQGSKMNTNTNINEKAEQKPNHSIICGKPAKFTKNHQCFCLKHAKKTNFLIPTNELRPAFINKQKVQKLFEMADQYHIPYDTKTKKGDIISLLNEYINDTCLESIHSVNSSKVDIITIGKNIQLKLDEMFYGNQNGEPFTIDYVIIENQISPIANRMKTIQGMISQYFIMKGNVNHIEFISSANKLKDLTNSNSSGTSVGLEKEKKKPLDYKDRKKAGIEKCLQLLNENPLFQKHFEHFEKHKKKDDLADCFLQGYWYLSQKLVG